MQLQEALALINNNHIGQQTGQQWADLGCGDGLFTKALARQLPDDSTIYAIDQKTPSVQTTSPGIQIENLRADFVKDPLNLPLLDGILMANAFHYVKDKAAFAQKLKSYCKPDHLLLLVEYDTDQPVPTWVPYPISFGSLKKFYTEVGYRTIEKLGERPSVYGRANMYAAIIAP